MQIKRLSGLQIEVLRLYRAFLRTVHQRNLGPDAEKYITQRFRQRVESVNN